MDVKQVIGAIVAMIFRIAFAVVIIVAVFHLAVQAYDFGFRIFAEEPMAEGNGRTVSVVVQEDKDAMAIGEMLEGKGLIRDARLFYIQERLSDYHGKIQPGTYELNTAMTIEEMIEAMATEQNEEESQSANIATEEPETAEESTMVVE